jgi:ribosome assembly protein 1
MMAQNLFGVEEVPAGNVLAIGGLEDTLFKTGTISSIAECNKFYIIL